MFKNLKLATINLQLFNEGAAGASAGGSGAGAVAGPAGTNGTLGSSNQANEGEKVVYGKQALPNTNANVNLDAEGKKTDGNSDKEFKKAEFEKLISGDYKDFFTEKTQQIINKRFAETKSLEEKLSSVNPILDMLSQKYGVSDPNKLIEAINNDDSLWEEIAENAGLTVDQYKKFAKMESENKMLKMKEETIQQNEFANRQYAQWQQQSEELRAEFPNFDLDTEAQSNEQFVSLLRAGIDVKTAYQVSHINDIKQATARAVETNVVNNIRAKGNRPTENGANATPGIVYKADPSKFTRKDILEIEKRVRNGEKIIL